MGFSKGRLYKAVFSAVLAIVMVFCMATPATAEDAFFHANLENGTPIEEKAKTDNEYVDSLIDIRNPDYADGSTTIPKASEEFWKKDKAAGVFKRSFPKGENQGDGTVFTYANFLKRGDKYYDVKLKIDKVSIECYGEETADGHEEAQIFVGNTDLTIGFDGKVPGSKEVKYTIEIVGNDTQKYEEIPGITMVLKGIDAKEAQMAIETTGTEVQSVAVSSDSETVQADPVEATADMNEASADAGDTDEDGAAEEAAGEDSGAAEPAAEEDAGAAEPAAEENIGENTASDGADGAYTDGDALIYENADSTEPDRVEAFTFDKSEYTPSNSNTWIREDGKGLIKVGNGSSSNSLYGVKEAADVIDVYLQTDKLSKEGTVGVVADKKTDSIQEAAAEDGSAEETGGAYYGSYINGTPVEDKAEIMFYADKVFEVKYDSDKNGKVSGKESESVDAGKNPKGSEDTANEGYKSIGWKCDKDVTLSDGTAIAKDTVITADQVKKVVVNDDLTFTAVHEYIPPKLSITKTADKASKEYTVGDTVTYTVTVKQTETGAVAKIVTVLDKVANGTQLQIDATSFSDNVKEYVSNGASTAAGYAFIIPELKTELKYTYKAKILRAGENISNTVTASTDAAVSTADADSSDGDTSSSITATATETVKAYAPEPSITKTATPTTAVQNAIITYTIKVSNKNDKTQILNAKVTDTIPAGLEYVTNSLTVSDTTSTAAYDNGKITVDIPSLTKEVTITFKAKVTANIARSIINTASLSGDNINPVNAYATITTRTSSTNNNSSAARRTTTTTTTNRSSATANNAAKTGTTENLLLFIMLAAVSFAVICTILRRREI